MIVLIWCQSFSYTMLFFNFSLSFILCESLMRKSTYVCHRSPMLWFGRAVGWVLSRPYFRTFPIRTWGSLPKLSTWI